MSDARCLQSSKDDVTVPIQCFEDEFETPRGHYLVTSAIPWSIPMKIYPKNKLAWCNGQD